jgi:hypothetical protein
MTTPTFWSNGAQRFRKPGSTARPASPTLIGCPSKIIVIAAAAACTPAS